MKQYSILFIIILCFFDLNGQIKPPAKEVGIISIEELKNSDHYQWFQNHHANYKVDTAVLDGHEKAITSFSFKIFVGTWCSDSKSFLPKFIKILEYLNIPNTQIEIVKIDRDKKRPMDLIGQYQIKFVPTAIFMEQGKEQNRIVEFTNKSIEEDIIQIVQKKYTPFHLN